MDTKIIQPPICTRKKIMQIIINIPLLRGQRDLRNSQNSETPRLLWDSYK